MGQTPFQSRWNRFFARLAVLTMVLALLPAPAAAAGSADIVISQVYGGGGNSGATLKNDFIELYNRGTTAVSVTGWSVQYASAGGSSWQKTNLSGTILPGRYYLVQEAAGAGGTVGLPAPDATGSIAMSATSGKVALVTSQTSLTCGASPGNCFPNPDIRDFAGYGSANNYEDGAPTATLSNTTAARRGGGGCTDNDNNGADFSTGAPTPRHSQSAPHGCTASLLGTGEASPDDPTIGNLTLLSVVVVPANSAAGNGADSTGVAVSADLTGLGGTTAQAFYDDGSHGDATAGDLIFSYAATVSLSAGGGAKTLPVSLSDAEGRSGSTGIAVTVVAVDAAPAVAATTPAAGATGVFPHQAVTVTFSEPVSVTGAWYSIACATTGAHSAAVSGGPTGYTLTPDAVFGSDESCTVTVSAAGVTDLDGIDPPDSLAADYSFSFVTAAVTRIHDVQGAAQLSPLAGQHVDYVPGIVTARSGNGFYMQDPDPDGDDATSEGIFVFNPAVSVSVGDSVAVAGRVSEFRPGGSGGTNLTTTEIGSPVVSVIASGNPLPAATVIGSGGRMPPTTLIDDDAVSNWESSGGFDPAGDGIDFWESLEGMLLQLNNAVASGPTNRFGEVPVLADDGAGAGVRTPRGGIVVRASDFNPERLLLDDTLTATPDVNVGDHFAGPIVGVLDYSFGNYKLNVLTSPVAVDGGLTRESTTAAAGAQLAVATFNVENLHPGNSAAKFSELAGLIVGNLQAPDIIAVEEVQDNNGPTGDGTVAANLTWGKLIAAIQSARGPTYDYRQVDPVDGQDGGQPGGNIRVGFLLRTDRGLSFVDRPGAGPTTANAVVTDAGGTHLLYSPGRIDPTNSAFADSRKPLAGEFLYNGHRLFVIANHFNSKGGDEPLFGRYQPPQRSSEIQRAQQAQVLHDFVAALVAADPGALVVAAGDFNDFEFSGAMTALRGSVLHDPILDLSEGERYTYVFEGNSQALDHILLSSNLYQNAAVEYDIVHVGAEFAAQASDHDPQVVRLSLPPLQLGTISGPTAPVLAGDTVTFAAAYTDAATSQSHTATWDWGDGTTSVVGAGGGTASGSHRYSCGGIYTVTLTLTGANTGTAAATFTYVIVQDPAGGTLTGGGWIATPSGKLHLAVTATISHGTPAGQVEINLSGAGQNLHGSVLDWLAVDGSTAYLQGSGRINGGGDYGFLLVVSDTGQGKNADRVRVQIWDKADQTIFYDSQPGAPLDAAPTTPLGGGELTIHP